MYYVNVSFAVLEDLWCEFHHCRYCCVGDAFAFLSSKRRWSVFCNTMQIFVLNQTISGHFYTFLSIWAFRCSPILLWCRGLCGSTVPLWRNELASQNCWISFRWRSTGDKSSIVKLLGKKHWTCPAASHLLSIFWDRSRGPRRADGQRLRLLYRWGAAYWAGCTTDPLQIPLKSCELVESWLIVVVNSWLVDGI